MPHLMLISCAGSLHSLVGNTVRLRLFYSSFLGYLRYLCIDVCFVLCCFL